jgi:hypothetical protein
MAARRRSGGLCRRVAALAGGVLVAAPSLATAREFPGVVIPEAERPALSSEIRGALARYDSVTAFPLPDLGDERMKELLDGEVVRFRDKWRLPGEGKDAKERHRVLAFRLVAAPRVDVWVSALDPHFVLNDRISAFVVEEDTTGESTLYQFMDTPWPIKNRHWVIDLSESVDVFRKTSGQVWEESWRLAPDGEAVARSLAEEGRTGDLSLDSVRGARYLDANDGAWAAFALRDDLTLIAYNLTIVLGGLIPEGLAARFAARALEDLLDRVAANVAKLPAHYVEGHAPIYAGDGTPIPPRALAAPPDSAAASP